MTKALNFDTGVEEYVINDTVHLRFNPADVSFTERFYDTFMTLDKRQDEFQERIDEIGDNREEFFEYARERDAEMREIIDGLLGAGVADQLFDGISCYALAGGMPIWINLLFAIAEEIRDAYGKEKAKSDPRLKKFDAQHEELLEKYRKATTKK